MHDCSWTCRIGALNLIKRGVIGTLSRNYGYSSNMSARSNSAYGASATLVNYNSLQMGHLTSVMTPVILAILTTTAVLQAEAVHAKKPFSLFRPFRRLLLGLALPILCGFEWHN